MSDSEHDGSLADWLSRIGLSWPARRADPLWSRSRANRSAGIHPTRALRRLLEILRTQEHPVVLDLGLMSGLNVEFFGNQLACKLLVHDLYSVLDIATAEPRPGGPTEAISRHMCQAPASVDGVLCWDICDYLTADAAKALVARLELVMKPGAVALLMFSTISYAAAELTRFVIEDCDHLDYRPLPSSLSQRQVWSSRDVTRVCAPLRVDATYLLAHGQREVLLRKAP